jgi:hypothetical protein
MAADVLTTGVWRLASGVIDKTISKHDLMACNTLFLPFILELFWPPDAESGRPFSGLLTRSQRLGVPPEPSGSLSRGCSNGEGHG